MLRYGLCTRCERRGCRVPEGAPLVCYACRYAGKTAYQLEVENGKALAPPERLAQLAERARLGLPLFPGVRRG